MESSENTTNQSQCDGRLEHVNSLHLGRASDLELQAEPQIGPFLSGTKIRSDRRGGFNEARLQEFSGWVSVVHLRLVHDGYCIMIINDG